jgi:integrase
MAEITQLPGNCRYGKITVTPANWDTKAADPAGTWLIQYRFYDDNTGKEKRERLKESKIKNLTEKQAHIRKTIEGIIEDLKAGFNPITGSTATAAPLDFIAAAKQERKNITISAALQYAYTKLNATDSYKSVTRSMLRDVTATIKKHNLQATPAAEFDELYIKNVLELTGKEKIKARAAMPPDERKKAKGEAWNNNRYNHYRALLNSLYLILEEEKIVPRVFTRGVKMLKVTKPKRTVMTQTERETLNNKANKIPAEFWAFIQIFYHSGRRTTELMAMKKEDLNLAASTGTVLMKKGRSNKYVDFTIKDIVAPLWAAINDAAAPGQYLFSKNLQPGAQAINPRQITRRFNRWFKQTGEIKSDFYSLKHANLDEVAAKRGAEVASKAAGHSSTVITLDYYLHGEKARQHELMKKMDNKL